MKRRVKRFVPAREFERSGHSGDFETASLMLYESTTAWHSRLMHALYHGVCYDPDGITVPSWRCVSRCIRRYAPALYSAMTDR